MTIHIHLYKVLDEENVWEQFKEEKKVNRKGKIRRLLKFIPLTGQTAHTVTWMDQW